jgi:hypothetical protein
MIEIIHAAVTWSLVGLIWMVQVVIYPQFRALGRGEFLAYHADYTRRISWVVGPLMLAEIGTAGGMWWNGEGGTWFLISLGLLAVNWISTALIQVPLHRKLERGFEAEAHRALVRTNWLRTAAWTGRGLLVVYGRG